MTRLLAFGDPQIGSGAGYGVLPGDRLRDQEAALDRTVDLAIELGVDAVIDCGDTFDGPVVTPEHYAAFQRPMRRLLAAGIPCLAVLGNGRHDCALRDVTAPAVVSDVCEFFAEPGVRKVGDVYVAMLPWCPISRLVAENDGGNRAELFQAAADRLIQVARGLKAQIPTDAPSILVPHFAISGAMLNNSLPVDDLREVILPLMELEGLGFSAVAAGHIHRRQFLSSLMPADEVIPIFYTGSLLPVDFSERDTDHGVSLITFDGPGPAHVEFIPIPSRPFVQVDADLTEIPAGPVFDDLILARLPKLLDGAVVKVSYRATREQAARVSHQSLTDAILRAGASKVMPIQHIVEAETRARVEGVDETVSPVEALGSWLGANSVDEALGEQVSLRTIDYLTRVASDSPATAGGVRPTRVRARGYRTFSELDFEIPRGVVALVGLNGAGKSSIVNGIDVGLFCGRGEAGALLTAGEDDFELTVEFESGGSPYRVRRGLRRGKAQTVDLETWTDNLGGAHLESWVPLSLSSADQTNERIQQLVGLSRKTFGSSAFLRQGDGAVFTEAGAAARKGVLIEVCGIDEWDALLGFAKADVAGAERELADIQRDFEIASTCVAEKTTVAGMLTTNRDLLTQATVDLGAAETGLEEAQARLAAVEAAAERVRTAQSELDGAVKDEARIRQALGEVAIAERNRVEAQARMAALAAAAERVPELEAKVAELREQAARADAAIATRSALQSRAQSLGEELERRANEAATRVAKANDLLGKAKHLRDTPADGETCDRCGNQLDADSRVRLIASYSEEASEITVKLANDKPSFDRLRNDHQTAVERVEGFSVPEVVDPAPVEAELAAARRAVQDRAQATADFRACAEKAAGAAALQVELDGATRITAAKRTALDEAQASVGDTDTLTAVVQRNRDYVASLRSDRERLTSAIARDAATMERIEDAEAQLVQLTADRVTVQAHLDVLRVCARAYSRDGVPALIIENSAIPHIEEEANRILEMLDTTYHVELRTQREQKNDQVTETLDIVIHDGTAERPYETFSGGERTRLNLALRIGLARLLAQRKAASSLLVIDEPEFLDEAGVIRLVDVLRSLTGVFESILLVTHHPAGAASCDRQIQVVKEGDRSRILTDTPPAIETLKEAA